MTHEEAFKIVRDAAQSYADDMASGFADGTYETDDSAKIYDALTLSADLSPRILVDVRGGMVQAVYANVPMHAVVLDWDNVKDGDIHPLLETKEANTQNRPDDFAEQSEAFVSREYPIEVW